MTPRNREPSFAYEDLLIVAQIVGRRVSFTDGEAESLARVRKVLDAASELNHVLWTYTHRAIASSHRGDAALDLTTDTAALHDALSDFARDVRALAVEYRRHASSGSGSDDDVRATTRSERPRDQEAT